MCCKTMEMVLQKHDFTTFIGLNRQFHFTIYQAAGSDHLMNTIISLWDLSERYRYRYMFIQDQGQAIKREHQAILECCKAHNGDRLREKTIYHLHQTLLGIK